MSNGGYGMQGNGTQDKFIVQRKQPATVKSEKYNGTSWSATNDMNITRNAHMFIGDSDSGIILGGSGQGEAMAANRVKGVRAAVFYNGPDEIIKLSRQHNNANILSLGARFMSEEEMYKTIEVWLSTDFESGRHQRRIEKLDES